LTLNKNQFQRKGKSSIYIFFSLILFHFLFGTFNTFAQDNYKFKELEINSSTKSKGDDSNSIPTNPFEIVDMLRRINSMNNATRPSDAIDDALKSFDMIKDENKI
tara:strand:- start:468 stop:782 length:315 start_codon:yes stop_codon:yes gene_type:complete